MTSDEMSVSQRIAFIEVLIRMLLAAHSEAVKVISPKKFLHTFVRISWGKAFTVSKYAHLYEGLR